MSESAPKLNTALSVINLKSSPTVKSAAIPAPPATVNAPSDALVFAVVAVIDTTPPEDIPIAFGSPAEPIVPAFLINMLSTNVTIPVLAIVIAVVALEAPIVPPSLITISSAKVTTSSPAIVIAATSAELFLIVRLPPLFVRVP